MQVFFRKSGIPRRWFCANNRERGSWTCFVIFIILGQYCGQIFEKSKNSTKSFGSEEGLLKIQRSNRRTNWNGLSSGRNFLKWRKYDVVAITVVSCWDEKLSFDIIAKSAKQLVDQIAGFGQPCSGIGRCSLWFTFLMAGKANKGIIIPTLYILKKNHIPIDAQCGKSKKKCNYLLFNFLLCWFYCGFTIVCTYFKIKHIKYT